MDIIRGLTNLRPRHRGSVATIGNFDGVHLGHRAVLRELGERGRALGLPVVVVTFEPQPQEFFARGAVTPRLTRLREKIAAFRDLGVDRVLLLRFDEKLARMPAPEFAERVLFEGLGPRHLAVGDDFRFGRDRGGDFAQLREWGKARGCTVVSMPSYTLDGMRVSSTRVREALATDGLELAARLLGRPYRMCGRVRHGDGRGRGVGFPTANIAVERRAVPVSGVYAVEVHGAGPMPRAGVANVGNRPTVDGARVLLEVHLLDYDGDLYGRVLEVEFLRKLRPEQRFASVAALVEQIARDADQARAFFAARRT